MIFATAIIRGCFKLSSFIPLLLVAALEEEALLLLRQTCIAVFAYLVQNLVDFLFLRLLISIVVPVGLVADVLISTMRLAFAVFPIGAPLVEELSAVAAPVQFTFRMFLPISNEKEAKEHTTEVGGVCHTVG